MGQAVVRYAKAILEKAEENKTSERIYQDMNFIIEKINENQALTDMLQHPLVSDNDKKQALEKIFGGTVTPLTISLFSVLKENNRFEILKEIADRVVYVHKRAKNEKEVEVTTAVPINDKLEAQITKTIKNLIKGDFTIKNTIDAQILGGFILRIDDLQYDDGISTKLKSFRKQIRSQK